MSVYLVYSWFHQEYLVGSRALTLRFNALTFVEESEKKEVRIDVRWEEGGQQSDAVMQQ